MVRSFTLVLMAALTLLSAPEVHAGRRHDGHRCRRDAECLSGTCCNGRCSPQSACANELAGPAALVTGGRPRSRRRAEPHRDIEATSVEQVHGERYLLW